MRAKEFIIEVKKGKISKRNQQSTRGLHTFSKTNISFDRMYDLNRIMMAVACTDGSFVPTIDSESWSGKFNTAHGYTDIENEMLKKAYKAVGLHHKDLNNGDLKSKELTTTYTQSPVQAFKGYKK